MKNSVLMVLAIVLIHSGLGETAMAGKNPFSVDVDTKFIPKSDIQRQSGDISVVEAHIRVRGNFTIFNEIPLKTSIGGNHYVIKDDIPAVTLPSSIKSRGLHLNTEVPVPFENYEQYFIGIGLNPSFQTAKGVAFASRGFRMRSSAYLIYKSSEILRLEGGITHRAEYDSEIFPYIGLTYQPDDALQFKVSSSESEILSRIIYKLTDKNNLFVEYAYELDEFEVSKGENEGKIIEYQDSSTGAGVDHKFNEHINVSLRAGGIFQRKIEYLDGTGKAIPEAAPYAAIKVVYNF